VATASATPSEPRSVPPTAAAISESRRSITSPPDRPQLLGRDAAVVERDRAVGELLIGLVPLAGDHDDVARLGLPHGEADRGAAVGLDDEASAALPPRPA
jgi:hypothetical protein